MSVDRIADLEAEVKRLRARCTRGADWLMRIHTELRELHFDLPHVLLTEDGVTDPGTTLVDELYLVAHSLDADVAMKWPS